MTSEWIMIYAAPDHALLALPDDNAVEGLVARPVLRGGEGMSSALMCSEEARIEAWRLLGRPGALSWIEECGNAVLGRMGAERTITGLRVIEGLLAVQEVLAAPDGLDDCVAVIYAATGEEDGRESAVVIDVAGERVIWSGSDKKAREARLSEAYVPVMGEVLVIRVWHEGQPALLRRAGGVRRSEFYAAVEREKGK